MRHLLFLMMLLSPIFAYTQSWKVEAEVAIRAHRMARVKLNFAGVAPTDIKVNLKMREHAFKWGTIMNVSHILDLEQMGFDKNSNHPYFLHFRHFNSITPENAGKWKFWINATNKSKYLEMVDWFNSIGIQNRGHTTIWPSITRWNAVPDFVTRAMDVVENGVIVKTKATVIREHIRQHVESQLPVLEAYNIYELDLINELINEGEIVKNLLALSSSERPKEHAEWHKWARAAAPEVALIVNEYNLFQSGNNFHQNFVSYVQQMLAEGAPIDGVGMQGHFFGTMPNYEELKRRLREVAVLGLPMVVTEFDMQEGGYAEMERVLYAIFSEPLLRGFSFWGAWDGRHWRNNAPMFRTDWSLKASGQAWFDLVKKKWWTDTTQIISSNSSFEVAAFLGNYDVYVEVNGKIIAQQFELTKAGQEININLDQTGYVIPTATLNFQNDKNVIFINEPLELSITSNTAIKSVVFKDGDRILGVDTMAYIFSSTKAGIFPINAIVEFVNGYRLQTPLKTLQVSAANASPFIQKVFPASGSSLLQQERIEIFVEAIDPNNDPMVATILDEDNNILAMDNNAPFYLTLLNLPLGSNRLRLKIEDDRFGINEQRLILNIIDANSSNLAKAQPLKADDDIEENSNKSIDVEGDLDLGEKIVGIRFEFAAIPEQAIIDSAFIQFVNQKSEQTGMIELIFQAEKSTNASPFRNSNANLSNRLLTTAQTKWNVPDWLDLGARSQEQKSPDLKPILDELLAQMRWTNKSPINIIVNKGNGNSKRSAFSYDQSPIDAPQLNVYYRINFDLSAPPAPNGLFYQAFGGSSGQLSWETPVSEAMLAYVIFVEGFDNPILVEDPTHLFFDLEVGRTYTVQIQAIGAYGLKSPLSAPFTFVPDQTTVSTQEIWNSDEVILLPNPANKQFSIQSERGTFSQIQILDCQGRIVKKSNEMLVDISDMPTGLYFVKIVSSEDKVVIKKLIIHK